MKKLWLECILALSIVVLIILRLTWEMPPELQTLTIKMLQVNFGLIHAYIAGRVFFGKVEWQYITNFNPRNVGRLVLYAVIVYSYAVGG